MRALVVRVVDDQVFVVGASSLAIAALMLCACLRIGAPAVQAAARVEIEHGAVIRHCDGSDLEETKLSSVEGGPVRTRTVRLRGRCVGRS